MSDQKNHENEYPLMLYIDGDAEKAHVIVKDAEEEKVAKAEGFIRHKAPAKASGGSR